MNVKFKVLLAIIVGIVISSTVVSNRASNEVEEHYVDYELADMELRLPFEYQLPFRSIARLSKLSKKKNEVNYLAFDAQLPDISPHITTKKSNIKQGWQNKIRIRLYVKERKKISEVIYNRMNQGLLVDSNEIYDEFAHFHYKLTKTAKPHQSVYLPLGTDNYNFWIRCIQKSEAPSPSCEVETHVREHLYLTYKYSSDYLPKWKEIHTKVTAKIQSFCMNKSCI